MNRQDVNREAKQLLGVVPGFLAALPDEHVASMWSTMRDLQLRPGRIPAKYQQLVMLAVAAHSKCRYCTDFHTEVARALGATKEEIAEAVILAGHTAQWSDFIGGVQYDFDEFKREVRVACEFLRRQGAGDAPRPPPGSGARSPRDDGRQVRT